MWGEGYALYFISPILGSKRDRFLLKATCEGDGGLKRHPISPRGHTWPPMHDESLKEECKRRDKSSSCLFKV